MQFLHPEWFYGLWTVLALFLFFLWAAQRKRKLLETFGQWSTLVMLTESHSLAKERLKKWLLIVIFLLLIMTLAQPQWGETKKEIRRRGVEIVFLVDTSLSMLAEDIPTGRIQKVKLEMKSFLRSLKGDRVGIVTFAGSGFIQSPLTLDYDAFLLFANALQVGFIPDAGTSLSEAIRTAVKSFPESKQKNHVVILLSDGEDLEGDVDSAIKIARDAKIRIYAIGTGTQEGAPIPLRAEGGKISGYKKDRAGEIVITKLNEELLKRITTETGGVYFPATPGEREIDWIYQHMKNLEKREFKQRMVIEREAHFQVFLGFALLVFFIEMFIGEVKQLKKSYA